MPAKAYPIDVTLETFRSAGLKCFNTRVFLNILCIFVKDSVFIPVKFKDSNLSASENIEDVIVTLDQSKELISKFLIPDPENIAPKLVTEDVSSPPQFIFFNDFVSLKELLKS